MATNQRFTAEPVTQPAVRPARAMATGTSGSAPKRERDARADAPTVPPPKLMREKAISRTEVDEPPGEPDVESEKGRPSGIRGRRPDPKSIPAATIDEVVADLSRDPRRERDD